MKLTVSPILLVVAVAGCLSVEFTSAAPRVVHYGPFASSAPASSTCGGTWAIDTFDLLFRVDTQANADGTYDVVAQFKDGTFVTIAGESPGACDTNPGGTVGAGVIGEMHGSIDVVVIDGILNPNADCSTGCDTTADFVQTVFGPAATFQVPTFTLHYGAGPNGQWMNASANRGGSHGDITGNP